jgi:hypothetical protein
MSDARWSDPRHYDARDHSDEWPRVYDARDRDGNDPREALMRDLDLPRGDERELVVDRDRVYELDGEDSRALAAVGAFRIVPEHDVDLPHDTLRHRGRADAARSCCAARRVDRCLIAGGVDRRCHGFQETQTFEERGQWLSRPSRARDGGIETHNGAA